MSYLNWYCKWMSSLRRRTADHYSLSNQPQYWKKNCPFNKYLATQVHLYVIQWSRTVGFTLRSPLSWGKIVPVPSILKGWVTCRPTRTHSRTEKFPPFVEDKTPEDTHTLVAELSHRRATIIKSISSVSLFVTFYKRSDHCALAGRHAQWNAIITNASCHVVWQKIFG